MEIERKYLIRELPEHLERYAYPVSYTHLDVYKRQAVHFGFALQNLSRGLRPIENRPNTQKTASRFLGARTIFGMAHA